MPDATETRDQKFVRLATARMNKALKAIRVMENLKSYPHTAAQAARVVTSLKEAVEKLEYALAGEKEAKRKDEFSFDV